MPSSASIAAAGLLGLIATAQPAAAVKFMSIGDWGDVGAKKIAGLMGKETPEFILAIGDNFYNTGITKGTKDPQWKEKFEDTFTAPSLQVPWYVCAGNHDYYGGQAGIEAEMAYSNISKRWNYPSLYHEKEVTSEDAGKTTVLLVSVDTWRINGGDTYVKFDPITNRSALRNKTLVEERYKSGAMEKGKRDTLLKMFKEEDPANPFTAAPDKAQLQWLDKVLAASTADWNIVYGHFPVFSITTGEHGDTPSLVKDLYPILQKNKVDMYFNGHDHILQHIEKGGVHFFGSGAGARNHKGVNSKYAGLKGYSEGHYGFMTHEGNATAMTTSFHIDNGETPYKVTVMKNTEGAVFGI